MSERQDAYLSADDLGKIGASLPEGFSASVDESLILDGGDIWQFRISHDGKSVVICVEDETELAVRCDMPLYVVEEDRYEPRWREPYAMLPNAIHAAIAKLKGGDE
jgi:hypothetical protein